MGAITGTLIKKTECSGHYHFQVFTAAVASASDAIDLSAYFTEILYVGVEITAGMDGDFQAIMPTFSGTTVTLTSKQADGGAADEFTTTTVRLLVLGAYN